MSCSCCQHAALQYVPSGNKTRLLQGLVDADNKKLYRNVRTVHITKEETTMINRRKLCRLSTHIDQMERMYLVSGDTLLLRSRQRKAFPRQTNKGNWLGPVALPLWSSSWRLPFATKKELYGFQRRPVGGPGPEDGNEGEDSDAKGAAAEEEQGATADGSACEETMHMKACIEGLSQSTGRGSKPIRPDSQVEPVFFHCFQASFFETLVDDYHLAAVLDLTPGPGLMAISCLKKRIPYMGVCLTEAHRTHLQENLLTMLLGEFQDETSPLYEPDYAGLLASAEKKTESKTKTKPSKTTKKTTPAGTDTDKQKPAKRKGNKKKDPGNVSEPSKKRRKSDAEADLGNEGGGDDDDDEDEVGELTEPDAGDTDDSDDAE